MKRSNKKKGFTLVELIVVIAILAILATVSIIAYLSFIKKANISNDISLTTQINTILEADEALGKPATATMLSQIQQPIRDTRHTSWETEYFHRNITQ